MDAYLHIPIHPSSFSQVPEIFPRRNCLSIPGSSIWDFNSALCLYKPDGDCGRTYSISGAQHSPVLRRLIYPSSVPGVPPGRPITIMGNHYKSRSNTKFSEIRPSSFSELQFCRHEVSDSLGHCQCSRRESQQNSSPAFPGSAGSVHYRLRISVPVGITQCSCRFSSVGSPSYVTSSVPFSGKLETSPRQFGPIYSNIPFLSCINQMVDESYHLLDRNSSSYSISRFPSIFRRQSLGLGRSFGTPRPRDPRPLGLCFPRLHINSLELRAVFLARQHFQNHIYNSCVMVASDNSSVVAYLKKQGGTYSSYLCRLVWELLYRCHHRNIHIQVRHIPGKLNVLADSLSRPDRIHPTKWSLDRGIAHQIFKLWGTPQVDLFATRLNHLLPLFVSPVPDHKACEVDAMS